MKTPEEIRKALECCVYHGSCKTCAYFGREGNCIGRLERDALTYIQQLEERSPTDAEPVRHGEWVYHEDDIMPWNSCSLCGCEAFDMHGANYCPNCGAKMDLGEQANAENKS